MKEKGIKAYYTIGEIAKLYEIGKDSLMYYERLGILCPRREENGYRLYDTTSIWRLNLIKELRSLDFPMKKIKEYVENRSIDTTKELLSEEITLIADKIKELEQYQMNIARRLDRMQEALEQDAFHQVVIKNLPARKAFLLKANIEKDEEVDFLIQQLQNAHEERFYLLGNNHIGAFFDKDKLKKGIGNQFEAVFYLLEEKEKEPYNFIVEEGLYATYSYRGTYEKSKDYLEEIVRFIEAKGYKIVGSPFEIYKIDVHETAAEKEFITEIQVLIEKRM